MKKRLIKYFLIVLLFVTYFSLVSFIWNRLGLGGIAGGVGVFGGTAIVLISSVVLSIITSHKLMDMIRS